MIKSLYNTINWYVKNPGVGKAGIILQYYGMWKDLHTLSVNISSDGWNALTDIAKNLKIQLTNEEDRWIFLFSIETYLNLLARAFTLSKLGRAATNNNDLANKILNSMRDIFTPSVFEWFLEALIDKGLDPTVKKSLDTNTNSLLRIINTINVASISFDTFRTLYQNILPREVRKSLGEFYTSEEIIDTVLESAQLNCNHIKRLYKEWSKLGRKPKILDPACGSGSFLVRLVYKIYQCLGCKPNMIDFIESILYGLDVNPFASELAKLNLVLAISDASQAICRQSYYPKELHVYWADSLATIKQRPDPTGNNILLIRVPSLASLTGQEDIIMPESDIINPIELIDITVHYISKGKSREEFKDNILKKIPHGLRHNYEILINDIWNSISKIIKSGNSRAIELLKSSIRMSRLLGEVDLVIGNPPWVRIHEISNKVREKLRSSYHFYGENSSYNPSFKKTRTPFQQQQDYSMAFIERGLELLKNNGVLAYVITSKITKTTYAGKLREELVKNNTILRIIDYSLYPRPLFSDVTNYPLIIAVRKTLPEPQHMIRITVHNTLGESMSFELPQEEISLSKNNKKSPWVFAPPEVIVGLRRLQSMGPRLGDIYEIMRGIMTSANELFIVRKILECKDDVALVELESGDTIEVEERLLYPMIRGEDIDPYKYRVNYYIIFPHDPDTLEPLWDLIQKDVLTKLGLLTKPWNVEARGTTLVYKGRNVEACDSLDKVINVLQQDGYIIKETKPCAVNACYEIRKDQSNLLVRLQKQGNDCRVYIEGLHVPGTPMATRHFIQNLSRLIRRDDYRINLPPWSIFRISKNKFKEYRIAWQENVKYFEASHLPIVESVYTCNKPSKRILVPIQTVYFIIENDRCKASLLLAYLNSKIARSLMKLWAWTSRGGYFRHISYTVGHLPLLPLEKLLKLCDLVDSSNLNFVNKHSSTIEQELIRTIKIDNNIYQRIVKYGEWLNEKSFNDSNNSITDNEK